MRTPARAALVALVAMVAAACSPAGSTPPASPDAPASEGSATATPVPSGGAASASATPTPGQLDLTVPGTAEELVARLVEAAGGSDVLMVTVTATDASVVVVKNGAAQAWAWRGGRIQQIPSDVTYVAQRAFDPADFSFHDLGALFRLAESVSGSRQGQSLQIVDYSAGLVSMSVSTNPESRPVFFQPDGTLLPTLDFTSEWGLTEGYRDVVGPRVGASSMGFGSATGVYLDSVPDAGGSFQRRQRMARTPVIATPRTASETLRRFDPGRVQPAVVWSVLQELREDGAFTLDTPWTCVVEDRAGTGTPLMYFTVGERSFVTTLNGVRR
ncbi:MAG: hypothetical protein QM708_11530 [Propioniciclava sp.]|uniref:hypothetical protein n=1 Tax=Propioniciclava sp. TaxID=2038686 RepID=UPI0039E40370